MGSFRLTNVVMVEPAGFGFNAETAETNRFQMPPGATIASGNEAARLARLEFAAAVRTLQRAGATVCLVADTALPPKPDAIFPNNWVSFHEDGTVVLYPLQSPSRRAERREALIDEAKSQLGFIETRRLDLSSEERNGRFLEGTGSLVLDREARIAYACRSPRTDESLVREWARQMDYEAVVFDAQSPDGTSVYHTNVLLWIGARIAGVGLPWIDAEDRDAIAARLGRAADSTQRDLLELDTRALWTFAGNMLEIPVARGRRLLALSATAAGNFGPEQLARLAAAGCEPVVVALPTIEMLGGGSIRCMLAEVPQC